MSEVVVIATAPSREMYEQVNKTLEGKVPEGLIVHTATETADGVRIVDFWESREAADAFGEQLLGPAIRALMGDEADGGPPLETLEPFSIMRG